MLFPVREHTAIRPFCGLYSGGMRKFCGPSLLDWGRCNTQAAAAAAAAVTAKSRGITALFGDLSYARISLYAMAIMPIRNVTSKYLEIFFIKMSLAPGIFEILSLHFFLHEQSLLHAASSFCPFLPVGNFLFLYCCLETILILQLGRQAHV